MEGLINVDDPDRIRVTSDTNREELLESNNGIPFQPATPMEKPLNEDEDNKLDYLRIKEEQLAYLQRLASLRSSREINASNLLSLPRRHVGSGRNLLKRHQRFYQNKKQGNESSNLSVALKAKAQFGRKIIEVAYIRNALFQGLPHSSPVATPTTLALVEQSLASSSNPKKQEPIIALSPSKADEIPECKPKLEIGSDRWLRSKAMDLDSQDPDHLLRVTAFGPPNYKGLEQRQLMLSAQQKKGEKIKVNTKDYDDNCFESEDVSTTAVYHQHQQSSPPDTMLAAEPNTNNLPDPDQLFTVRLDSVEDLPPKDELKRKNYSLKTSQNTLANDAWPKHFPFSVNLARIQISEGLTPPKMMKYSDTFDTDEKVRKRIRKLKYEGLWSATRLPKVYEVPRTKNHWDYLLEEMTWMAEDFASERKWKLNAAKQIAKMVERNHMEVKHMKIEKWMIANEEATQWNFLFDSTSIEDLLMYPKQYSSSSQVWMANGKDQEPEKEKPFMIYEPPTPPPDGVEDTVEPFIDASLGYLYNYEIMKESELPPIYVSKTKTVALPLKNEYASSAAESCPFPDSDSLFLFDPKIQGRIIIKHRNQVLSQRSLRPLIEPLPLSFLKSACVSPHKQICPGGQGWLVEEDANLVNTTVVRSTLQTFQSQPPLFPAHTMNWQFVADAGKMIGMSVKTPMTNILRYETHSQFGTRDSAPTNYQHGTQNVKFERMWSAKTDRKKSVKASAPARLFKDTHFKGSITIFNRRKMDEKYLHLHPKYQMINDRVPEPENVLKLNPEDKHQVLPPIITSPSLVSGIMVENELVSAASAWTFQTPASAPIKMEVSSSHLPKPSISIANKVEITQCGQLTMEVKTSAALKLSPPQPPVSATATSKEEMPPPKIKETAKMGMEQEATNKVSTSSVFVVNKSETMSSSSPQFPVPPLVRPGLTPIDTFIRPVQQQHRLGTCGSTFTPSIPIIVFQLPQVVNSNGAWRQAMFPPGFLDKIRAQYGPGPFHIRFQAPPALTTNTPPPPRSTVAISSRQFPIKVEQALVPQQLAVGTTPGLISKMQTEVIQVAPIRPLSGRVFSVAQPQPIVPRNVASILAPIGSVSPVNITKLRPRSSASTTTLLRPSGTIQALARATRPKMITRTTQPCPATSFQQFPQTKVRITQPLASMTGQLYPKSYGSNARQIPVLPPSVPASLMQLEQLVSLGNIAKPAIISHGRRSVYGQQQPSLVLVQHPPPQQLDQPNISAAAGRVAAESGDNLTDNNRH